MSPYYALLTIRDIANVWVVGGTLEGERDRHKGKSGQGGMGLSILKGAKHITVIGVTSNKMWGDGFYVKDAEDVRSVTADFNRRQGLSVIHADGVLVLNSVVKNTRGASQRRHRFGARPGIARDQEIKNVRIEGSKFINNAGGGIIVAGKQARISKLELTRNSFTNNRPFVVNSAPWVASGICGNRQTSRQVAPSGGFNAYAEPVDIVTFQDDCGETSFIVYRQGKKKKKPN